MSSSRELSAKIDSVRTTLSNANVDWDKRVNAVCLLFPQLSLLQLKMLRGVCLHGGMDYEEELVAELQTLEPALLTSVKDLRSQVLREACITVS